jgi:hypothetical protein
MLKVEKTKLAPPIERPEDVGSLLEAVRELRPDRYAMFATFLYTGARRKGVRPAGPTGRMRPSMRSCVRGRGLEPPLLSEPEPKANGTVEKISSFVS